MSGRRNPFEEIERLFNRMSRQFEDEIGGSLPQMGGMPGTQPAMDVCDEGDDLVVTADLPGYDKENIDVQLRGDTLHVSAERREERQQEGERGQGRYIRQERRHESVNRSVTLPEQVQEDEVTAEYQNGVLTVRLPKLRASSGDGHRIDIE
jgi:HSP20 family protein